MKNPTRALAAFTAPPSVKVGPYEVREITLGLAGVLEAIESPLVTGRKPQRPMEWASTLFAMTRSTEESERLLASGGAKAYAATAAAWADTVPLAHARRMLEAVLAAGKRLADVSPDEDDDGETGGDAAPGNSPAATAGSSPSPRSAPSASAGPGAS